jgi:uncharacterized protein
MGRNSWVESVESISKLTVKPVSKSFGRLTVTKGIDGSLIEIPFAVIKGKKEKPTMWIQGSMHGDEFVGSAAIRRIIDGLMPESLHGTVIAIPIINTTAYSAHRRHSPIDNRDLYLSFAGNPLGLFSERVAGVLLQEMVSSLTADDFLFDLHGSPAGCIMQPWVAYKATGDVSEEKSRKAAEASGIRVVWKNVPCLDYKEGFGESSTLSDEAIPVGSFSMELLKRLRLGMVTIESGSSFALETDILLQYEGVMNVMKHLGMLEGSLKKLSEDKVHIIDTRRAMAKDRGFWQPFVQPGLMVEKNQRIAVVTDEFGRMKEDITAPESGILLINKLSSFIDPLSDVLSERYGAFVGLEGG